MKFCKQTLIFLSLLISLVIGVHSGNSDQRILDSGPSLFSNATQKLADAFRTTARQEKESIKNLGDSLTNVITDVALATIDYTEVGINYWTMPARIFNNILHKNETTSFADALTDPVKTYFNSVGKAVNSTINVYQDLKVSTRKAAKASFDVAFAFPKFGLNLMGDRGEKIRKSLRESFSRYEAVLTRTAEEYKALAKKFATSGLNMFKKFANATVVPKLTKVLQSVTNGTLSKKFEMLSLKTIQTRNYGLEVARNLTRGGIFFNKAAFDLEALLQKYSMNLITEEDARNYAKVLNEHIKATRDSLVDSENSLRMAFRGIVQLFKNAGTHKNELLLALDYVRKNIKDKDPAALDMAVNVTLEAFKSIGQELREYGGIIGKAGKDLVRTGFNIAIAIPKFGFGILKLQVESLGKRFVDFVYKIEKAVLSIVVKFTSAGQTISKGGDEVETSVLEEQEPDDRSDFDKIQAELDKVAEKMLQTTESDYL